METIPVPPKRKCETKADALKITQNARADILEKAKQELREEILRAAAKGEYQVSKELHENMNLCDQDKIVEELNSRGFKVDYEYSCFGSKITIEWYE